MILPASHFFMLATVTLEPPKSELYDVRPRPVCADVAEVGGVHAPRQQAQAHGHAQQETDDSFFTGIPSFMDAAKLNTAYGNIML